MPVERIESDPLFLMRHDARVPSAFLVKVVCREFGRGAIMLLHSITRPCVNQRLGR